MTNEEKNIKDYSYYLYLFVSINFIFYMAFILEKGLNFMDDTFKKFILERGIFAAILALVTFILNGLLTAKFKFILVFWSKEYFYPGCRIFTDLINNDNRIDKSLLVAKYGELPTEPNAQNTLWYRIFKKYEFDSMIFESHRNFLISRDLTGLSFLSFIIYGAMAIVSMFVYDISIKRFLFYIIFLLCQYLLLVVVSRNYGERFACNVIAKECCSVKGS